MRTRACRAPSPTDVRDSEARSIAASCLAGVLSEPDARWRIAALLQGSDVVEQVVGSIKVRSGELDEVTERMYDLAYAAIVGIGGASKLDLAKLAGGTSLCGWARRYLSSPQARTTAQRPLWARQRREVLTGEVDEQRFAAHETLVAPLVGAGMLDEERVEAAIACLGEHAKGLRPLGRTHLAARTLTAVYRLPQVGRSIDLPCRGDLLAAVESDGRLVQQALRSIAESPARSVADGNLDDDPAAEVVSQLAGLFAEWSPEQVCSLLALPPLVAHQLVVAALTPVPPPQTTHVVQLQRQVAALGTTEQAARVLADSFASVVAETTTSEYDARHELAVKAAAQRTAERTRFEQVVRQIIAGGWTRLGSTPGEVESHLRSMLDEVRYGELVATAA